MKLLIATQNEWVYLPAALGAICRERREDLVGIATSPPLSTHGSFWNGIRRHVGLFGRADFSFPTSADARRFRQLGGRFF